MSGTTVIKSPAMRRLLVAVCGLALLIISGGFVLISFWIGADVRTISRVAMQQYEGDRVEALLQFVEDANHSLKDRNRAVWALGQLGDRRALPVLGKYYTGEPCDHRTALCQHELGKAIKLVDGGINVTAMIWRHPASK